jgi:hypothetical protein
MSSPLTIGESADHFLGVKDFEDAFSEKLSAYVCSKIKEYDFRYRHLIESEKQECLARFEEVLRSGNLARAGQERQTQWEKGWNENLEQLQRAGDLGSIVPRYFDKYDVVRWRQEWIRPTSDAFEYRMLAIIQDWLFDQYLRDKDFIYEFGCGTGHNLFRIRQINPEATLFGLDWASSSQKILEKLRHDHIDDKIYGRHFNYFEPDRTFHLQRRSAIVTVASLEQIGSQFGAFLSYLLEQKPSMCIHIEPISELLDPSNLLDRLSIEYFKKRNYLSGYLSALRELEAKKKIKILRAQRTYIGSFFIEGYSVIVWQPL